MLIKKALVEEAKLVYTIVQDTIHHVYPKYYPNEVVAFFSNHHTMDNILEDIKQQNVILLWNDEKCVATGSIHGNEICRVFVLPQYQGCGYGNQIMMYLEEESSIHHATARIDASLPGSFFYEKRHYKTVQHQMITTENDIRLVYEVMEKQVLRNTSKIDYEGKCFVPKVNSANGEVSYQTLFYYHQDGSLLWATYEGGDIIKGFLIGQVYSNGEVEFHYQHQNKQQQIRIGNCYSIPHILEDGSIELREAWRWLNGDETKGTSILIEKK